MGILKRFSTLPSPIQWFYIEIRSGWERVCRTDESPACVWQDAANFVSAYRCDNLGKARWVYLGKQQLHGLPVRGVLFGPQSYAAPLFSFGEDFVLAEYDVAHR